MFKSKYLFIGLLCIHSLLLLFLVDNLSISYKEALTYFYDKGSLLYAITNLSTTLFGQNDFALRIPFILFYVGSSILLYLLTDDYFKRKADQFISVAIFMMLPGVNSAALLVNESIIVLFFTLLYLYIYKKRDKECYALLFLLLFIDNSFAILFLALFLKALSKKDNLLLFVSLALFGVSMGLYGFEIGGKPRGYFLDTFGVYSTIFSPLVFIYFVYTIYRVGIKHTNKDMFWYISVTALALSLLFSLRQKVAIEDFAPFVVIGIPIMVKMLMHSLRVRLKEFQKGYYILGGTIVTVLVINFSIVLLNKYLYLFIENPQKHFAYNYHIAKELAKELQQREIYKVFTYDDEMQIRLKFYGIYSSSDTILYSYLGEKSGEKIEIRYHGKAVKTFYIHPKER
jgi:4-amino-4-deoxy-L-arabinose transferase-like glycosyltransferase